MAPASNKEQEELQRKAYELRKDIISMVHAAGSGHIGGSLSAIDLLLVLYERAMKHDPKKPSWEGRDRFVLSAGHLCPALYAVLAEQGYFEKELLATLRKMGSPLQGHPEYGSLPGIENTSGPLGQGYAFAVGKALAAKQQGKRWHVYCLASDGEHDEGAVWEAAQEAAHQKLGNLCIIIDRNDIQIGGRTKDVMDLRDLKEKYLAFGWKVVEVDGHHYDLIEDAFEYFTKHHDDQPFCIIAHTTLGKGVTFMERNPSWHGKAPSDEEYAFAMSELDRRLRTQSLHRQLKRREVLS